MVQRELTNLTVRLPALLIELKRNKSEDIAIQQIKDRAYSTVLKNYTGNITYDEKTKIHSCKIETLTK